MLSIKSKLLPCDLSALAVFTAIYGWFTYKLRYMALFADEATYLTYVQRFIQGYRPFIDDWGGEQLTAPFLYLPYKLYITLTGGNEGAVFFMRCVYLAVCMIFFWYLYLKLRDRGFWGLFATAAFSAIVPAVIFSLSYYTMHVHALVLFCAIMFLSKKEPAPYKIVFSGFLFACAVLLEPPIAPIYFIYTVLVIAHNFSKKHVLSSYDFILNKKTWLYLSLGVFVCFVFFMVWIACTGGIIETIRAFPTFLKYDGYGFSASTDSAIYSFEKIKKAYKLFGLSLFIPAPIIIIAAALSDRLHFNLNKKRIIFIASIVFVGGAMLVTAVHYIPFFTDVYEKKYYPSYCTAMPTFPLMLLGLMWYFLLEDKNRKLFCVWCLGFSVSLLVDAFGEITNSTSFAFAVPAVILMLPKLYTELKRSGSVAREQKQKIRKQKIQELRAKKKTEAQNDMERKLKPVLPVCVVAMVSLICALSTFHIYMQGCNFGKWKEFKPINTILTQGIFKGIYVAYTTESGYSFMLSDLKQISNDSNVYLHVVMNEPELYLDTNCGISVCDPWYYAEDTILRQCDWWKLHRDKLPDYIFIPRVNCNIFKDYDDKKEIADYIDLYDELFEFDIIYGEGGVLLKVTKVLL